MYQTAEPFCMLLDFVPEKQMNELRRLGRGKGIKRPDDLTRFRQLQTEIRDALRTTLGIEINIPPSQLADELLTYDMMVPPTARRIREQTGVRCDHVLRSFGDCQPGFVKKGPDGKSAECLAEMSFGPCSDAFVHGADSILQPAMLAEEMLSKKERLAEVRQVRWLRPITKNLRMRMQEGEKVETQDGTAPCMDGTFATNSGRLLSFAGYELEKSPVRIMTQGNEVGFQMACTCPYSTQINRGNYNFGCNNTLNSFWSASYRDTPLRISILLEMLSSGVLEMSKTETRDSEMKLVACVKNLQLPTNPHHTFRRDDVLRMRPLRDKAKTGKSGMNILPFEYQFPYQDGSSEAVMAFTNSHKVATKCVGRS